MIKAKEWDISDERLEYIKDMMKDMKGIRTTCRGSVQTS